MKIIILELNEVSPEIFNKFIGLSLKGKYKSDFYKTRTFDEGQLSPWITWATVHRGVTNTFHGINDINQYSDFADKTYPTIFQNCLDKGLSVGLVNTMHSGILADQENEKYKFLIPEAFASNSYCVPKSLIDFQKFNLAMSKASARVVSKKIPKDLNLFKAIISYMRNTKRLRALRVVLRQFFLEILYPFTKVRRRTIQSDLIFDLFVSLQKSESPDLSVFFTNHVASSMHRFWEASFPEEYKKRVASEKWILKFKNEIPLAMETARNYINVLKNIVDHSKETQLWVMSSMGQEKVENYIPQDFFWDIADMNLYISSCLNKKVNVKVLPQMIPIYSFSAKKHLIEDFSKFLINTRNIKLRAKTESTLAFSINNQKNFLLKGKEYIYPKGMIKKNIDEKTSSAAYHSPEGFLLRYGPNLSKIKKDNFEKDGAIPTNKIKEILELELYKKH